MHSRRRVAVTVVPEPVKESLATPGSEAYAEQEVEFPGGAPSVTLAGTLSVPTGAGPHPAVVLMSGSGPQDRDESLPGLTLRPFALLADALARAGIAVLRYDDRGTARSTGVHATATIDEFTADGTAALGWLRERDEVDRSRTGVLGHSEGGIYAARIAAEDPDVAFVVGLAPVARSGFDLLVAQAEGIARSQGASEADVLLARDFAADLYTAAMANDMGAAEQIVRGYYLALYDRQAEAVRAQMGDRDAFVQSQADMHLGALASPGFVSLLRSDAGADWRRVTAPTLGVFGGKDVLVVAALEAPALQGALEAAGNADHTVVTLPDANHLFQAATTGGLTEFATLEQTFTPELLPLVVDWVVDHSDISTAN